MRAQVVLFFRQVLGIPLVSTEVLSQRATGYQNWVEAFACKHQIPIEWAETGGRKEDYVLPGMGRLIEQNAHGVYFTFKKQLISDDVAVEAHCWSQLLWIAIRGACDCVVSGRLVLREALLPGKG